MAMRGIDNNDVHAGRHQRLDAFIRIGPGPNRCADPQCAKFVFAGSRVILGLLEILGRNHAPESKIVIDDKDFLDSMLVQQEQNLVLVRTFPDGHELVFRRHDGRDRSVKLGFESQIPIGDDTDQLVSIDNRYARNISFRW